MLLLQNFFHRAGPVETGQSAIRGGPHGPPVRQEAGHVSARQSVLGADAAHLLHTGRRVNQPDPHDPVGRARPEFRADLRDGLDLQARPKRRVGHGPILARSNPPSPAYGGRG